MALHIIAEYRLHICFSRPISQECIFRCIFLYHQLFYSLVLFLILSFRCVLIYRRFLITCYLISLITGSLAFPFSHFNILEVMFKAFGNGFGRNTLKYIHSFYLMTIIGLYSMLCAKVDISNHKPSGKKSDHNSLVFYTYGKLLYNME